MNKGLYGMPRGRRGRVSFTSFAGARVRLNSNVSIPNATFTFIPWDVEMWQVGGVHELVINPSRFTAPVEGWYEVGANSDIPLPFLTNGEPVLAVYKTDAAVGVRGRALAQEDWLGVISDPILNVTVVDHFYPGDYAEIAIFQSDGSTQTLGASTNADSSRACAWMARVG